MATEGQRTVSGSLLTIGLSVLIMTSCASWRGDQTAEVTVAQVIEMSNSGMPADEIIRRLEDSGTVYRLKASELAGLEDRGVPPAVIDYMQETHLASVRVDTRYQDWNNWAWNGGYCYNRAFSGMR